MWPCFNLSVQISLSPSTKSIMLKNHIVSSICWCRISYTAVCSSAVFGPNTGWKSKYLETRDILRAFTVKSAMWKMDPKSSVCKFQCCKPANFLLWHSLWSIFRSNKVSVHYMQPAIKHLNGFLRSSWNIYTCKHWKFLSSVIIH